MNGRNLFSKEVATLAAVLASLSLVTRMYDFMVDVDIDTMGTAGLLWWFAALYIFPFIALGILSIDFCVNLSRRR